uniref:Uncharacterized protein n=1 Tax=Rhizophora mucronata TaxID=61149 RepID=A0A2P2NPY0_RHIMU
MHIQEMGNLQVFVGGQSIKRYQALFPFCLTPFLSFLPIEH